MADLFSSEWSQAFMETWNDDEEIISSLQRAGFNSVVAFGMLDTEEPAFIMTIQDGLVSSVNSATLDDVEWDVRATKENWLSLIVEPPGLMRLGIAYTSRKLCFLKGDYVTMIQDPDLAAAFVKTFVLMEKCSDH
ncbi:MAG: SCP-2 sterol transfer family protein [Gammaproteobacteria bacterium]|jgi:hypothetical protein|nr:SCP-2 sterol transfer family protein [Gammaproteobacteria bacterium]